MLTTLPTQAAIQHARDNNRCNSVHPGPIATDMIKDTLADRAAWEQRLYDGRVKGRQRLSWPPVSPA